MRTYLFFLSFLFFVAPELTLSSTIDFSRTLYVGAHGEDVRELQRFLNIDTETVVAETGAGSHGNETNYFGNATKRALIKFQEKYRTEVLAPVGLTFGTGVLGEKTRHKINKLLKSTQSEITAKIKIEPELSIAKGEVILMFPSQYSGRPGTMIALSGAGFTATDNTIYFGNNYTVTKASSWNGQSITFKVPNIPKGIYSLVVKNARGDSNKGTFFIVTDGITPEPQIDSVLPEISTRGGAVVIKGSGFLHNGNIIQYGAGVIKNVSSVDGISLSFSIPQDILNATTTAFTKKIHLPIGAVVINENGVSNVKSYILEI